MLNSEACRVGAIADQVLENIENRVVSSVTYRMDGDHTSEVEGSLSHLGCALTVQSVDAPGVGSVRERLVHRGRVPAEAAVGKILPTMEADTPFGPVNSLLGFHQVRTRFGDDQDVHVDRQVWCEAGQRFDLIADTAPYRLAG